MLFTLASIVNCVSVPHNFVKSRKMGYYLCIFSDIRMPGKRVMEVQSEMLLQ